MHHQPTSDAAQHCDTCCDFLLMHQSQISYLGAVYCLISHLLMATVISSTCCPRVNALHGCWVGGFHWLLTTSHMQATHSAQATNTKCTCFFNVHVLVPLSHRQQALPMPSNSGTSAKSEHCWSLVVSCAKLCSELLIMRQWSKACMFLCVGIWARALLLVHWSKDASILALSWCNDVRIIPKFSTTVCVCV